MITTRLEFLYWAARRQRTAAYCMRWDPDAFAALDAAAYCLDRP